MATKKTKATPKAKAEPIPALAEVGKDPNLPLLPGNHVSFYTAKHDGRGSVVIATERGSWSGPVSQGADWRVTKLLETGDGVIDVTFYEDGKEVAHGTFE